MLKNCKCCHPAGAQAPKDPCISLKIQMQRAFSPGKPGDQDDIGGAFFTILLVFLGTSDRPKALAA
jgi:hypothetical protein